MTVGLPQDLAPNLAENAIFFTFNKLGVKHMSLVAAAGG